MDSQEATSSPDQALVTEFAGSRWRLFWLALKTGTFTVLTLGFYRFWMKTRLRRWYWSAIRPGGVPLEYTGDPVEKLLGFLLAVVILAFYIGVVNLLLMFASFSLFQGNFTAYLLSFIGVIPLWFFARYRARRYILARTRWRGLRLGLEKGAWGYAGRAIWHWALTILTLGLLWPRMTYWLEKYRTDRTFYGSVRLNQGGNWKMLFRYLWHPAIGGASSGLLIFVADEMQNVGVLYLLFITLPWLGFGLAHYKAHSFRLLTECKSAGGVEFRAAPRPWRIFGIYLFGYGIAAIGIAVLLVGLLFLLVIAAAGATTGDLEKLVSALPNWILTLSGMGLYFSVFLLWSALTHTFVTMPLIRHFAETLTVVNPQALGRISQRPRDEFAEAEGFAEALDVGAAI